MSSSAYIIYSNALLFNDIISTLYHPFNRSLVNALDDIFSVRKIIKHGVLSFIDINHIEEHVTDRKERKKIYTTLCKYDYIEPLKHLYKCWKLDISLQYICIKKDNPRLLEWLNKQSDFSHNYTRTDVMHAIECCGIDMVSYLHLYSSYRDEIFNSDTLKHSIQYDKFDIFKYILKVFGRNVVCRDISYMIHYIIMFSRTEMMSHLYEYLNRRTSNILSDIDIELPDILSIGFDDNMIDWIHNNTSILSSCIGRILSKSIESNNICIVEWIYMHYPQEKCSLTTLEYCISQGNSIFYWIYENRSICKFDWSFSTILKLAIKYKQVYLIKWIYQYAPEVFTEETKMQCIRECPQIILWFFTNIGIVITETIMDTIVINNELDILKAVLSDADAYNTYKNYRESMISMTVYLRYTEMNRFMQKSIL